MLLIRVLKTLTKGKQGKRKVIDLSIMNIVKGENDCGPVRNLIVSGFRVHTNIKRWKSMFRVQMIAVSVLSVAFSKPYTFVTVHVAFLDAAGGLEVWRTLYGYSVWRNSGRVAVIERKSSTSLSGRQDEYGEDPQNTDTHSKGPILSA